MTEANDPEHYATRAARALALAETANDPGIAEIHRRMADSYSELAHYAAGHRPPLEFATS